MKWIPRALWDVEAVSIEGVRTWIAIGLTQKVKESALISLTGRFHLWLHYYGVIYEKCMIIFSHFALASKTFILTNLSIHPWCYPEPYIPSHIDHKWIATSIDTCWLYFSQRQSHGGEVMIAIRDKIPAIAVNVYLQLLSPTQLRLRCICQSNAPQTIYYMLYL